MRITKSLFVLGLLFLSSIQVFAKSEKENCGLVIRGRVTDIKFEKGKRSVYFDIKLALEFKNEGKASIVLFKPEFDGKYWLGGTSLRAVEKGESICSFEAWQSVAGGMRKYRKLGEKLDVPVPPDKYTKILMPDETWYLEDETGLEVILERDRNIAQATEGFVIDDGFRCVSWKEMKSLSAQMWLEVTYELTPWNVGYYKPNLVENLKKRWETFGNVLVDVDEKDQYDGFKITSKPIPIDFSKVRKKLLK